MLKLIIVKKNPSEVTQCYSCEEAFSIVCASCDINQEISYVCPSCKRTVRMSYGQIALNGKVTCLECMQSIPDVISISEKEIGRKGFHIGGLV
jgi:protein-arginine kinase activator protein McsA